MLGVISLGLLLPACLLESTIERGSAKVVGETLHVEVAVRRRCGALKLSVASLASVQNRDGWHDSKMIVLAQCTGDPGGGPIAEMDLREYHQALLDVAERPPSSAMHRVSISVREHVTGPRIATAEYGFVPDCSVDLPKIEMPLGEQRLTWRDCGTFWRTDACAPRADPTLDCLKQAFEGSAGVSRLIELGGDAWILHRADHLWGRSEYVFWDGSEGFETEWNEWPWEDRY